MGVFTALYLVLGGYKAMAMIDMIFGMIMSSACASSWRSARSPAGGGLAAITANARPRRPAT